MTGRPQRTTGLVAVVAALAAALPATAQRPPVHLTATERGPAAGVYLYSLTDPERPAPLASVMFPEGVHTATLVDIGGRRYAFAAKNPPAPALLIYEVTR